MRKIYFNLLLLITLFSACAQPTNDVVLIQKLDSLKKITAAQDSTLLDSVAVDSSALKKEVNKITKDIEKQLKDSLKEVIIKKEEVKTVGTTGKKGTKKIKQDSFDDITGMNIKFAGIVKQDTLNMKVYVLATFDKDFEGKLKLKALDKNKKEVKKAQKIKGKYVKSDKTIDQASLFVKQAALTQQLITFEFDELAELTDIDYFEISFSK